MRHYFSVLAAAFFLAVGLILSAGAVEIEKPEAVNGAGYAIISQLFDGSTGSTSFIRLINANSGNSTFNVLVINTGNGITLGSAAITVPPYAAPQYPLTGSDNSIFTLAGVAPSANASYALYIQDSDVGAGYAHVTFNGATSLFESQSTCTTPLNQRLTSQNRQMLANVHTSALAGNNYPSVIGIHNYSTVATSVRLTVYDAANGGSIGNVVQTIAANGTLTITENQLETLLGFTPTSTQLHINIIVNHSSGAAAPVTLTQTIRNIQLGGEINMGQVCAVNSLSATVTTPVPVSSDPVAYCGTFTIPGAPGAQSYWPHVFKVSAINNKVTGAIGFVHDDDRDGGSFYGTISGTAISGTTNGNLTPFTGTIQNGLFRAAYPTPYGTVNITASTQECR
jgi:hypothetical protein